MKKDDERPRVQGMGRVQSCGGSYIAFPAEPQSRDLQVCTWPARLPGSQAVLKCRPDCRGAVRVFLGSRHRLCGSVFTLLPWDGQVGAPRVLGQSCNTCRPLVSRVPSIRHCLQQHPSVVSSEVVPGVCKYDCLSE